MEKTTPSTRQGLLMFFALLAGYTAFAANWVAGSSLSSQITEHYFAGQAVPSVIKQVVNYSITVARIFANFLAAFVLLRLGIKRAASLAVLLLLFALVAIWLPNYYLYVLARMIMAVGGSMVMVYMNPLVSRFVAREQKVVFSTLITVSYNVGAFIVALAFAFWLDLMHHNWQLTMTAFSGLLVLVALFWFAVAADFDTGSGGELKDNYGYGQALRDPFNWTFALGFGGFLFLYVMSLTTYPAVLPQHLPLLHTGWITLSGGGGGFGGPLPRLGGGPHPAPAAAHVCPLRLPDDWLHAAGLPGGELVAGAQLWLHVPVRLLHVQPVLHFPEHAPRAAKYESAEGYADFRRHLGPGLHLLHPAEHHLELRAGPPGLDGVDDLLLRSVEPVFAGPMAAAGNL